MPQLTIDIPDDKVQMVGRAFQVVQGDTETAGEAWNRLKAAMIRDLKYKVIVMRRRELEESNVAAETETIITEA